VTTTPNDLRHRNAPAPDVPCLYAVNDVYAAVQGEGVQTGVPMVLVRLHGCPVGCVFCDTKETWERSAATRVDTLAEALGTNPRWAEVSATEIAAHVATCVDQLRQFDRYDGIGWVLLTGGEPAEQTLRPLVRALHGEGVRVALETSGTATGHVGAGCDHICVSPKINNPGGRPLRYEAFVGADEIKHVVGKPEHIEQLDTLLAWLADGQGLDLRRTAVCLQPMSQSERATQLCVEAAMQRGWRVSVQVHKVMGVR
jgi:7-carboxy-7-deazaguanine synthase